MQVYGSPLSPFVRKVYLVAAEKGVAVEPAPFTPGQPSPGFLEASPFRKIPAIRDGDFTLADSTAIAAYLDAKHPEPPLYPAEPRQRGKAVWFEEVADTLIGPAGASIVFNRFVAPKVLGRPGDEEAAAKGEAALPPLLDWLETQAPAQGWLVDGCFSIADIAMATMLRTLLYVGWGPDPAKRPATAAWYERVAARPAWREVAAIEDQQAARFAPA